MGKWLAIAGAALVVVLFLLWKQLDAPSATAAPPKKADKPYDALAAAKATVAEEHAKAGVVEPPPPPPAPDGKPQKIDVAGDEFFYRFQENVPKVLSRKVALCYEGVAKRLHRNQKLVLQFHIKIRDGEVTISDVKASANTIGDPGLEACFTQAVQRGGWHDDTLPDWEADDELVIRPERGLKKYMRDNIDYVGAPAPPPDSPVIRPNDPQP